MDDQTGGDRRAAHAPKAVLAVVAMLLILAAIPAGSGARPTDRTGPDFEPKYGSAKEEMPVCVKTPKKGRLCVHWVRTGSQRATSKWARKTASIFATVWRTEVGGLGFKAPLPDTGGLRRGPNRSAIDIYLANVGGEGDTLAYCAPTKAANGSGGKDSSSSYCVVDNDLAEFSGLGISAVDALRDTAAHEFFHVIQAGYDGRNEPQWLTEGTAVWMQGQVFDELDANRAFLDASPLSDPQIPLDAMDRAGFETLTGFDYGSWIFWQFLSEAHGGASVIRKVWTEAGKGGAKDKIDPAAAAATASGKTFAELLSEFAVWNYTIGDPDSYSEGTAILASLHDSRPPADAVFQLPAGAFASGPRTVSIAPRAISYVRVDNPASPTCQLTVSAAGGIDIGTRLLLDRGAASTPRFATAGSNTVLLLPGQSAIIAATNPTETTRNLDYSLGATC